MSFLDRASTFLAERVAPRLVFGRLRDEAALADLERQARDELDARIRLGRPGPEEWQRRVRPGSEPAAPECAAARPVADRVPDPAPALRPVLGRSTRPVGVHTVTLHALVQPARPPRATEETPLTQRRA